MAVEHLTAVRLRQLLDYDPGTGAFTWRVLTGKARPGEPAGYLAGDDRLKRVHIGIAGRRYKAHRLAWLYVHGEWPAGEIDHRNGDPSDNRIDNLRVVTRQVNAQNMRRPRGQTASGLLGAHWDRRRNNYRAHIKVDGQVRYLGAFPTAKEAHEVYVEAKRRLHEGCTL